MQKESGDQLDGPWVRARPLARRKCRGGWIVSSPGAHPELVHISNSVWALLQMLDTPTSLSTLQDLIHESSGDTPEEAAAFLAELPDTLRSLQQRGLVQRANDR